MKKIFLTGAGGFIGSNILKSNYSQDYEYVALIKKSPESFPRIKNIRYVQGDIGQLDLLKREMSGCDSVIHLAAVTAYNSIAQESITAFDNYLRGILNIISAVEYNDIKTIIYPSSGKVYENNSIGIYSEDNPLLPKVLMGKYKHKVEDILRLYSAISPNRDIALLRIFNVYGPGQSDKFLIPKIIEGIHKGKLVLGDLSVKRDYIYIDDLMRAIFTVHNNLQPGINVYNLGSGQAISIEEIIQTASKLMRKNINVEFDNNQVRLEEEMIETASIEKIFKLGWRPEVNLEEGLRTTIKQYSSDLIKFSSYII